MVKDVKKKEEKRRQLAIRKRGNIVHFVTPDKEVFTTSLAMFKNVLYGSYLFLYVDLREYNEQRTLKYKEDKKMEKYKKALKNKKQH